MTTPGSRSGEDQVIRPDGHPGIYGVVHFKNRAVGVLPVDGRGRVWLVGQYRYPLEAYSWEIPEGGSPESETPEATAIRELREETGLTAGQIELVATSHLSNAVSDEVGYVFRATDLTEGPDDPEGCERLHVAMLRMGRSLGHAQARRDHRFPQRHRTPARGGETPRIGRDGMSIFLERPFLMPGRDVS